MTPIWIITVIILALITAAMIAIGQVLNKYHAKTRAPAEDDRTKGCWTGRDDEGYTLQELARFEPMREPSRRPRHYKPGGKEHK